MPRLLVIDDEPKIRKFLHISLAASGYEIVEADTGATGIAAAREDGIDLVILDLGLPDMSGQEVISAIREESTVPIIVLSVRADEFDKVEALDRGAQDYVVKPFGLAEFLARIRAALRLNTPKDKDAILVAGPVRMDFARRIVTRGEEELHLSKREYELLRFMGDHPDHVLTHKEILTAVWGPAHTEDTAYLRVYVNQLRQKLEADPTKPKVILTEPGVGYRLRTDGA